MKKQLLFTIAFLTAITTFAQLVVSPSVGETTVLASNIPNHTAVSTTAGSVWNGESADSPYRQLRDVTEPIADINGTYSFDVETSTGSANAIITINFRKMRGNIGTVEISVNGSVEETLTLGVDAGTATGYEADEYTTDPLVLSETSSTILIEFKDIEDSTAGRTGVRVYSAVVNVTQTLSDDNVNANTEGISIYPNPATDNFNINSNEAVNTVSVYSLNGQLIKSFSTSNSYDVSNLAPGLYSVKIATASGSKTIKLIKK